MFPIGCYETWKRRDLTSVTQTLVASRFNYARHGATLVKGSDDTTSTECGSMDAGGTQEIGSYHFSITGIALAPDKLLCPI